MGERLRLSQEKPGARVNHKTFGLNKTKSQSNQSLVDRILNLQRTIGNQAVTRLIRTGVIQASLKIGQPGDIYEKEADRVADQMMRMPEQAILRQVEEEEEEKIQTKPLAEQITHLVQRQVVPEEEEEPVQAALMENRQLQRQEEEEEEEMILPKIDSDSNSEVPRVIESDINALKEGGQPLSESTRSFFEPRFGIDFSHVRVHTDDRAVEAARSINARAFTTGRDIVFGSGQYSPGTSSGKYLLAHELTHVMQQEANIRGRMRSPGERKNGSRRFHQAVQSQNIIRRYKVEASSILYLGEPVHEVLTLVTLRNAIENLPENLQNEILNELEIELDMLPELESTEAHNLWIEELDQAVAQFVRGAVWPDDPAGHLFSTAEGLEYSSGWDWFAAFDEDEKEVITNLTARSHYGDLQFFHGMEELGVSPGDTWDKIIRWCKFLVTIIRDNINPAATIQGFEGKYNFNLDSFFPFEEFGDWTIGRLFGNPDMDALQLKQRAMGALLHHIQDSFTESHVQRDPETGEIRQFQYYEGQSTERHESRDVWGEGTNLIERIRNTPGAPEALEQGAKLLEMFFEGKSVTEIVAFLEEDVFKLSPDARPAGPAVEFLEEENIRDLLKNEEGEFDLDRAEVFRGLSARETVTLCRELISGIRERRDRADELGIAINTADLKQALIIVLYMQQNESDFVQTVNELSTRYISSALDPVHWDQFLVVCAHNSPCGENLGARLIEEEENDDAARMLINGVIIGNDTISVEIEKMTPLEWAGVIRAMIEGRCGDEDENTILLLLKNSDEDAFKTIIDNLGIDYIDSGLDGEEWDSFLILCTEKYPGDVSFVAGKILEEENDDAAWKIVGRLSFWRNMDKFSANDWTNIIRALLNGSCGDRDEDAIVKIVMHLKEENALYVVNRDIGEDVMDSGVDGEQWDTVAGIMREGGFDWD
jgi:hypothetical protein